jgi:aspartyl-tRNA synthetase
MVIVRREGFSNDQWLLEGVNLLDLKYRAAGYFAADPSQLVRPNRCLDRLHRMVDQSLSALPRDDFDYVWLVDVPPYNPQLVAGMRPVWRGPGSILYQTH